MKKFLPFAVLALIGIVAGFYITSKKSPALETIQTFEETKTLDENNRTPTTEERAEIKFTGKVLAGSTSPLLEYNKSDYEKAIASDRLIVLYFYANWCPICRNETAKALYPAFNELKTDGVVGFRINFNDSDTDKDEQSLARKYGVAYQHTKVFIKNGKQILKAPDEWSKQRYLNEINKRI